LLECVAVFFFFFFSFLPKKKSSSSPLMDRKKQFATVALGKNTRQRRPSTVKLFSSSANPFHEPSPSSPSLAAPQLPQRDDSSLDARKNLASSIDNHAERDNLTFDEQQNHRSSVGGHDVEQLALYRSREPQLVKLASAQQPFQFANAQELVGNVQGFRPRREEERTHPEEWEQMSASYNDWELGMLHKLAKGNLFCPFGFVFFFFFFFVL
jgi:hypothetical protein